MTRNSRPTNRGSTLILTLWALLLLSAAVFAWVKFIDQELMAAFQANAGLEAKASAHSGVWVALHPLVKRNSPLLKASFDRDHGYKVKLVGEGGKLNLNWLLAGLEQDPNLRTILDTYFYRLGLSYKERATLIDCMLDWTQPAQGNNVHRLNGARDTETYKNPHRPFQSIDEVAQVKGSESLVSWPGWQEGFTIYSQGPVDLQFAPVSVIEILPGVGDARAQRFVQLRQGPDKIDGTEDDLIFKDARSALSYLGFGGAAADQLGPYVMLNDPTYSVQSVGQSGKVYRQVEVIAQKVGGGNPNILRWKEL